MALVMAFSYDSRPIQTILNQIRNINKRDGIDLQPNYQRGYIWSSDFKDKLLYSITFSLIGLLLNMSNLIPSSTSINVISHISGVISIILYPNSLKLTNSILDNPYTKIHLLLSSIIHTPVYTYKFNLRLH